MSTIKHPGAIKNVNEDEFDLGSSSSKYMSELFPNTPGASSFESVVKIYKREQTSIDGVVDFDDQALLAASFIGGYTSVANSTLNETTIMEHEVFNQDVFITHSEVDGSASCNYYIEMEQMKLAGDEATVATLKDMRGRE